MSVTRAGPQPSRAIAGKSRAALDTPLDCAAALWVAVCVDDAVLLGAFQRASSTLEPTCGELFRRGSGGPEIVLAPATIHVALALAHPAVLVACDPGRIVNRLVRPLLRAVTKTGRPAHFFGRDWVSAERRPVAWVGFGHDATSNRTLFEAFVAVRVPFSGPGRPSHLGKVPGTLESISGRPIDPLHVADMIIDAYVQAYNVDVTEGSPPADVGAQAERVDAEPPWAATKLEAIGLVGAGPDAGGLFRVGGDLLVSRDALAQLESRAAHAQPGEVGTIVDETLAAPGVALDGVRSLSNVRDVIIEAQGFSPVSRR